MIHKFLLSKLLIVLVTTFELIRSHDVSKNAVDSAPRLAFLFIPRPQPRRLIRRENRTRHRSQCRGFEPCSLERLIVNRSS